MFHKLLKYLTIGIVNLLLSAGEASSYFCLKTIYHLPCDESNDFAFVLTFILTIIFVFILRLVALPLLYNIKNSYFYDYLTRFGNDRKYMFKILLISVFIDIVLIFIQSFLDSSEYRSYWSNVSYVANITFFTGSSITAYLSFLIYIKLKMYYERQKKAE